MGSHLLQTQQHLQNHLQLAPGAGKVWFGCVYPAEEKNPTSKEGHAVKKEVKEAAEERSGLPG